MALSQFNTHKPTIKLNIHSHNKQTSNRFPSQLRVMQDRLYWTTQHWTVLTSLHDGMLMSPRRKWHITNPTTSTQPTLQTFLAAHTRRRLTGHSYSRYVPSPHTPDQTDTLHQARHTLSPKRVYLSHPREKKKKMPARKTALTQTHRVNLEKTRCLIR